MKQCISDAYIGFTLYFRISPWTTRTRKHFFIRNTLLMTFCIVKVFYMEDDETQAPFYVLFWVRSSMIQPLWSIFFIFLVSFRKKGQYFSIHNIIKPFCLEQFFCWIISSVYSKHTRYPQKYCALLITTINIFEKKNAFFFKLW